MEMATDIDTGEAAKMIAEVEAKPQKLVVTLADLAEAFSELGDILKDQSHEWTQRMDALARFQSLLQHHLFDPTFFAPIMADRFVPGFVSQLEDRRSTLCKEACATVTAMALALRREFEPLSTQLVPVLLRLVIVTIKLISESGHNCILSILLYSKSSVALFADAVASHPHMVARARGAEYIREILKIHPKEDLDVAVDVIGQSVVKGLSDADAATRSAAKSAFALFAQHWPDRAEAAKSTMPAPALKLVSEPEKKAAAARPGFKQFIQKKPAMGGSVSEPAVRVSAAAKTASTPSRGASFKPFVDQPASVSTSAADVIKPSLLQSASAPAAPEAMDAYVVPKHVFDRHIERIAATPEKRFRDRTNLPSAKSQKTPGKDCATKVLAPLAPSQLHNTQQQPHQQQQQQAASQCGQHVPTYLQQPETVVTPQTRRVVAVPRLSLSGVLVTPLPSPGGSRKSPAVQAAFSPSSAMASLTLERRRPQPAVLTHAPIKASSPIATRTRNKQEEAKRPRVKPHRLHF